MGAAVDISIIHQGFRGPPVVRVNLVMLCVVCIRQSLPCFVTSLHLCWINVCGCGSCGLSQCGISSSLSPDSLNPESLLAVPDATPAATADPNA